MSRSKRRTPIMGMTTCRSEKEDKRHANRSLRRATKVAIVKGTEVMPLIREVSEVYSFGKDGKQTIDLARPDAWKWMRK